MCQPLLPDFPSLRLESVEASNDRILVRAVSCTTIAVCPCCGVGTQQIHSRYQRTLTDLPWREIPVQIKLTVRKFFCQNPDCPRKVFVERLPAVAAPHAQKTARLADLLKQFAWFVGGEMAARIAKLLGMTVSADAFLYSLHAQDYKRRESVTPRVLGIDDFAFRRGQTYGTLLVDMEKHRPIDLLPDREGKTVEKWLCLHPGIEIVCRDRSTIYTEAVTKALPKAIQVADRWHLLKNLGESLTRFFDQQRATLKEAAPLLTWEGGALPLVWPPSKGVATDQTRQDHRACRYERYEQVMALYREGISLRAIGRQLDMARGTVHRYVASEGFPEIALHEPHPSSLDPYKDYLNRRWIAGCHNAGQLYREAQAQGFSGTYSWLRRYIAGLRRGQEQQEPQAHSKGRKAVVTTGAKPPSSRSVAGMLLRPPQNLSPEEKAFLEQLCLASEPIRSVCSLTNRFLTMVRQRRREDLSVWLTETKQSGLPALVGFAQGLEHDLAAVTAGLSLSWSSGPVEGQVNRLKLVKRSMYGRARFPLLKARVLPATV
jgi:transposase